MQLTNAQQYLVKTDKNLVYHFFLDNDKSLHYSIYSSNDKIIESDQLVASIIEFSVTIDKRGKIHLICITQEGELIYYINQNDKWNYRTISKLDFKSNIYRYLTLYVIGSYIHIIYNKSNLLTPMLSSIEHIYWNQSGINKAVVSNYLHGRYPSPPQVSVDSLYNLHLVYKVYHKNSHQLYYSKFNIAIKKWSSGELITNLQEDHSHPYIFVDKKNNLHLVWCTIEQNNFILKYKKKINVTNSKAKWWSTQSLSNKNSNTLSPILIQASNTLKIYCKQNNQIIEIISQDFGQSWKVTDDNLYKIEDPKIIRYSNCKENEENLFVNHVYGNVNGKIDVAGIVLLNSPEDETITTKPQEEVIQTVFDTNLNPPPITLNNINKIDPLIGGNSVGKASHPIEENRVNTTNPMIEKNTVNEASSAVEENVVNDQIEAISPSNNSYGTNENHHPHKMLSQLLTDYEALKTKIIQIEDEKQNLSKTITDCESSLNLLEEKIVDYKKQMLTLQDKLSEISTNNSLFQRFINLFK